MKTKIRTDIRSAVTCMALLGVAACSSGEARPPPISDGVRDSGARPKDASATPSADAAGGSEFDAHDASESVIDSAVDDGESGRLSDGESGLSSDDAESPGDSSTAGDAHARDGAVADAFMGTTDGAMVEPVCTPTARWSVPVLVDGVPSFPSQPLMTITSDELTMAWVVDAGGGRGGVYVADRASASAAFGVAVPVTLSTFVLPGSDASPGDGSDGGSPEGGLQGSGYFAFDRVALSADGLTLVGARAGGAEMAQFIRVARGEPFVGLAQTTRYKALATMLGPGEMLGDPVLSADGNDFVYSKYGQSQTMSVYESLQNGTNPWPMGAPQLATALVPTQGVRRRPMGLSADRLTLFVWDETTGATVGVFRGSPTAPFNFATSYGSYFSAQVNAACTRIYYVAPSSAGFGVAQVNAVP